MKICNLKQLSEEAFILKNISAIYQRPPYRNLDVRNRIFNGFIALDKGECIYTWNGGSWHLQSGDILYLPLGSNHSLRAVGETLAFYRVDFTILNADGEDIIFSERPMPLCRDADSMTMGKIKKLTELFLQKERFFKASALLFDIFDEVANTNAGEQSALGRVTEYIDHNFTKNFTTSDLESLCYLGRAQMYRLFKKETGFSPIEYRNHLRIERAKALLGRGICSVGEAAALLGFENIYYFSRVFKKHTALSPTEYIKYAREQSAQ